MGIENNFWSLSCVNIKRNKKIRGFGYFFGLSFPLLTPSYPYIEGNVGSLWCINHDGAIMGNNTRGAEVIV